VVVASKPADMRADANAPQRGQPAPREILVGLLAAPAMADMAAQLAQNLPERLAERFPGV